MATTNDCIQVSATLKAITAKGAGTTVQLELQDALHEYHTITERMVADVRAAMGGAA